MCILELQKFSNSIKCGVLHWNLEIWLVLHSLVVEGELHERGFDSLNLIAQSNSSSKGLWKPTKGVSSARRCDRGFPHQGQLSGDHDSGRPAKEMPEFVNKFRKPEGRPEWKPQRFRYAMNYRWPKSHLNFQSHCRSPRPVSSNEIYLPNVLMSIIIMLRYFRKIGKQPIAKWTGLQVSGDDYYFFWGKVVTWNTKK